MVCTSSAGVILVETQLSGTRCAELCSERTGLAVRAALDAGVNRPLGSVESADRKAWFRAGAAGIVLIKVHLGF